MILLLKKKSILSEKENMRNQMQMIRVREGAVGVRQTKWAITPSSEALGFLFGLDREKKLDLFMR